MGRRKRSVTIRINNLPSKKRKIANENLLRIQSAREKENHILFAPCGPREVSEVVKAWFNDSEDLDAEITHELSTLFGIFVPEPGTANQEPEENYLTVPEPLSVVRVRPASPFDPSEPSESDLELSHPDFEDSKGLSSPSGAFRPSSSRQPSKADLSKALILPDESYEELVYPCCNPAEAIACAFCHSR